MVVLVSAGLFVASAMQAEQVDLGFRSDHLLTLGVDAGLAHYDEPTALAAFDREESGTAHGEYRRVKCDPHCTRRLSGARLG